MTEANEPRTSAEAVLAQLAGNPLARILRSAGVGTWSWDISTDVFSWSVGPENKAGTPQLRFETAEELVLFTHADDQETLRDALLSSRNEGRDLRQRFRYRRVDGGYGRVLMDGICIGPGVPPGSVVGISRDETAEMVAETKISQLFDERDSVARALETALLPPKLPAVPGLRVDAAYQSSEGAATGDFYDLFPLRKGEWGLTIGDVGGHGPAAAAITTAVRYALRAAALVRRSPSRVLQAANTAHLAATRERFTTCHYVRIGTTSSGRLKLRLATAGHPAMLVRRSTGDVEELAGTGPMLGLLEAPEYEEITAYLSQGDIVVAFTDGLTEARRNDEEFGDARVKALISAWEGPIDGMAHHLHNAAHAFAGGEPQDDIATVVLQVAGADDPTA